MAKIYIQHEKHGIQTFRAVEADHVQKLIYLITPQRYDRATEKWEFEPGTKVECQQITMGERTFLLTLKRSDDHDHD